MVNFFSNIGLNTRTTVGVSVSSNNIIEMVCVDKATRSITKYAARELRYNNAIREIVDYDEFETTLRDMFKEIGLSPSSCNVILNLPNVQFSFVSIPALLEDEQVTNVILSDVEQLYLFKRNNPIISWNSVDESKESDKKRIVYAAVQEDSINNVREVFDKLGVKLIAVENSHSSIIKGIQYSRIVEDEMSRDELFNILLITSNSYAVFSLKGNRVVDYYEEPLAIKSFTNDEVYLAISSAAGSALDSRPGQNLLIVSETNDVSAELLAEKIVFDGSIKYLDRNKFSDRAFMNIEFSILQSYIPTISLEAVGAASYSYEYFSLKFNLLSSFVEKSDGSVYSTSINIRLFGKEIEVERKAIVIILSAIAGGTVIVFVFLLILLNIFNKKLTDELVDIGNQQAECDRQLSTVQGTEGGPNPLVVSREIYTNNKKNISLFGALSSEIPPEVWVESFYINSDGEVIIVGKSTGSDHIYMFFRGLKNYNSDLFLSKLQLDNSVDPMGAGLGKSIYLFEIDSSKNKKPPQPADGSTPVPAQEAGGANPAGSPSPDAQTTPQIQPVNPPSANPNLPPLPTEPN